MGSDKSLRYSWTPDAPRFSRRLIVAAMPATGTRFFARVMRWHRYDVRHEALGLDGGVGYNVLRLLKKDSNKDGHIFHMVRNPLRVFSSLHGLGVKRVRGISQKNFPEVNTDQPDLDFLMEFWLYLHDQFQDASEYTFRVEDFTKMGEPFRRVVETTQHGLQPKAFQEVSNTHGTRREKLGYRTISWDELDMANPDLCKQILSRTEQYGYVESVRVP